MSKSNSYGDYIKKYNEANYQIHYTYTDGADGFDRYDEMETVDIFLKTSEEVLCHLLKLIERGELEDYYIMDLNSGITYKDVSSFIADYIPSNKQKFYWQVFLSRGVDTAGCKDHLLNENAKGVLKGSDRPIEFPQDSETLTLTESTSGTVSIVLDVDKIDLKYLKDCAIILVDAINRIDTCNQEPGSIKHDLSLMNKLLKFINEAIDYKQKSQKEDEDYQLYLKLKERFEGCK